MKHSIQIAVLLALSGCSVIPGTEAHREKLARVALHDALVDPSAAQFEDVVGPSSIGLFCGRVNEKNRMGGFDGFTRFMVRQDGSDPIFELRNGVPDPGFDFNYRGCHGAS